MGNLTGRMPTRGQKDPFYVKLKDAAGNPINSGNPLPTSAAITDSYYAVKVTVSGSVTYVGKAAVGSSQASAVWQAQKIDESSGTVITWADGNSNFDNVATDLTSLTYS